MLYLPRFSCLVALLCVFTSLGGGARLQGQSPEEGIAATIETRTGDMVEGIFVSATETEVVFRVAGQPLTIPVETIRYISFDGRIGTSTDGGEEFEEIKLRAAIGALRSLKAQVDALDFERPESQVVFVASLNAALPAITTFLSCHQSVITGRMSTMPLGWPCGITVRPQIATERSIAVICYRPVGMWITPIS